MGLNNNTKMAKNPNIYLTYYPYYVKYDGYGCVSVSLFYLWKNNDCRQNTNHRKKPTKNI